MKFKLLFAALVAAMLALAPSKPVQAQTYSYWYTYTDTRGSTPVNCRWRVLADVQYPYNWYNYLPTNGSASVPHRTWNGVFLEALNPLGLGSTYMWLNGDMRRWDTKYNTWVYFPDVTYMGWYPPYEGPMSYNRQFANPTSGVDYEIIGLSPSGEWHHCDGTMTAQNQELYISLSIFERQFYSVHY